MKKIAVIPARGGSKGLPGKNIKILNGKPLIAYSIIEAKKSNLFDRVIVSTDSETIATIAKEYGAEVPFLRPENLSNDITSSDDVIAHAINFMKKNGEEYDYVCKLQPTSPLRTAENINQAFRLLVEKKADSIVGVCECEHSPLWTGTIGNDLRIDNFLNKTLAASSRQTLEQYYRLNGAIYMSTINHFKENHNFFGSNSIAYIMPKEESIDIDDILDFKFAETLMKERL